MNKYTLYNKSTSESIKESQKYLVLAKELSLDTSKRFYLRIINGIPIDVNCLTPNELKREQPAYFQEVPEDIYNRYIDIVNGKSKSNVRSLLGI